MAWAEGALWVGQYRERKIHQIDPETGKILRTIESNRFVTGVTWVDGELWHATWEADQSDIRRIDPKTGETLEQLDMPAGVGVSGLESDGADRFYCGDGSGAEGPRRATAEAREVTRWGAPVDWHAPSGPQDETLWTGGRQAMTPSVRARTSGERGRWRRLRSRGHRDRETRIGGLWLAGQRRIASSGPMSARSRIDEERVIRNSGRSFDPRRRRCAISASCVA